jgi:hypothetical protein
MKIQKALVNLKSKAKVNKIISCNITTSDIKSQIEVSNKALFNPYLQPEEFEKAFTYKHKNGKYIEWAKKWATKPITIGWWNVDKDIEQGSARFNCGGAYPNKLSNLFYRSKALQSPFIMKLAMRFLDRRTEVEGNVAEQQPKISSNSVFVYRDPSNYFINRRGAERLALAFLIVQGVNLSGLFMYAFLGVWFGVIVNLIFIFTIYLIVILIYFYFFTCLF